MPLNIHVLQLRHNLNQQVDPNGELLAFFDDCEGQAGFKISGYWLPQNLLDVPRLKGGYFYAHTRRFPGGGPAPSEFIMRIEEIVDVHDQRMPEYQFALWNRIRGENRFVGRFGMILRPVSNIEQAWTWRGRLPMDHF